MPINREGGGEWRRCGERVRGVTGVGCCRCSSAAWGQEEGYDGYS